MPIASTHTYHLHVAGQVQGVGFRPFVWRLARAHGLLGWVNNTTDGVHVVFNATASQATAFTDALLREAPELARITAHELETIEWQEFTDFSIVHSTADAPPNLLLSPDFGLCADCRRELHDPSNRRWGYPFITCTNCGPRFSIVTGLPYDRERTTMHPFVQCPECQAEYDDPANRRYFSQTNSCSVCGLQLQLLDAAGTEISAPLQTALAWMLEGKILAVKGIGGYLLLCDATNSMAIALLRQRKRRPTKPFALLYASIEQVEGDAELHADELAQLQSPAAPIVLLHRRGVPVSGLCSEAVAPGLDQIGVMLPYAPLLEVLAHGMGRPLVATSGNISGSPIIFEDKKALQALVPIADGILRHNRDIAVPQDDSVVRRSPGHRQQIVLRRSRGFAPTFLFDAPPGTNNPSPAQAQTPSGPLRQAPNFKLRDSNSILALGATMKSSFAWQHRRNLYVSQYLGDLESYDTQEAFEHTLRHFLALFRERPEAIAVDKHPDYFSTQLGKRLAAEWGVPFREVQHHAAHFGAVLAENGRFLGESPATLPVLGVIWDGTGYGDDGQVWGGEFFRFDGNSIRRVGHFEPFAFLLGDKMPREPRISALSLAYALDGSGPLLEPKFSAQEWALYPKILQKGDLLQTSSVGRLFDGVASMLGMADRVYYEGEAAMQLEQAAARYFRREGLRRPAAGDNIISENTLIPTQAIVKQILVEIQNGLEVDKIAAWFHLRLIEAIRFQARQHDCRILAFSGGVWQNALLVDLALELLRPEFELWFHRQLSPNDEGISFGQLMVALEAD